MYAVTANTGNSLQTTHNGLDFTSKWQQRFFEPITERIQAKQSDKKIALKSVFSS